MICKRCGTQLSDGTLFCPNCGYSMKNSVGQNNSAAPQYSQGTQSGYASNPQYPQQGTQSGYASYPQYPQQGAQNGYTSNPQYPQQGAQNGYTPNPQYPKSYPAPAAQGMGWYKFLIYFALWAGAIANFMMGIFQMTGEQYEAYRELIYSYCEGLQAVDIIYGLMAIGVGAFMIFVRFKLAQFRSNAPTLLNRCYVMAAACNILYLIAIAVVTESSLSELGGVEMFIGSIVGAAVMVIINTVYFNNRKAMFVR